MYLFGILPEAVIRNFLKTVVLTTYARQKFTRKGVFNRVHIRASWYVSVNTLKFKFCLFTVLTWIPIVKKKFSIDTFLKCFTEVIFNKLSKHVNIYVTKILFTEYYSSLQAIATKKWATLPPDSTCLPFTV